MHTTRVVTALLTPRAPCSAGRCPGLGSPVPRRAPPRAVRRASAWDARWLDARRTPGGAGWPYCGGPPYGVGPPYGRRAAVLRARVDGRYASHLHARRDRHAAELLPATVLEAARLRQVAPRDAARHGQRDDDGEKDDHAGKIRLALVVLDVLGHGHLFFVIARSAHRPVRHAVARLEAHLFGDLVVVPVLARALEIRGATVLVKLPPGFGVSKLTARARDVVFIVMAVVAGVRARQGARA